jgi:hypothetical protein
MNVRFLLDENLDPHLKAAILRWNPTIDVLRVGDPTAPELGTLDPDILLYLKTAQRVLVTGNRKSMPFHIADHLAAGHHHWGVFLVRKGTTIGRLAEELYLIWAASNAEEWLDQERRVPL